MKGTELDAPAAIAPRADGATKVRHVAPRPCDDRIEGSIDRPLSAPFAPCPHDRVGKAFVLIAHQLTISAAKV
jgi:hypothetical protein